MFEKLRVKIIHKLKGLTLEEVQKPKNIEFKSFTAVPEKVTAKMILHAGREYAPAVVQQRLSYQLADALVDGGYVNFFASEENNGSMEHIICAYLWVIKKDACDARISEENHESI